MLEAHEEDQLLLWTGADLTPASFSPLGWEAFRAGVGPIWLAGRTAREIGPEWGVYEEALRLKGWRASAKERRAWKKSMTPRD